MAKPFVRRTLTAKQPRGADEFMELVMTNIESFFKGVDADLPKLAGKAAQLVINESLPLTPIEYGSLRESAHTVVDRGPKGNVRGIAAFGGPNKEVRPTLNAPRGIVDYAIIVHEDMSLHHPIGGPKFLERGGQLAAKQIEAMFIQAMKDKTRG